MSNVQQATQQQQQPQEQFKQQGQQEKPGLLQKGPTPATLATREVKRLLNNKYQGRYIERFSSPIFNLRKFNSWVRGTLISNFVSPGNSVLEVGCGRGSDLGVYWQINIGNYTGVEMAMNALEKAIERYNALNARFDATFICEDFFNESLHNVIESGKMFDVVSSNYNVNLAFGSEHHARTFLRNVVDRLNPNGYFIGTMMDPYMVLQQLYGSEDQTKFGNALFGIQFDQPYKEVNDRVQNNDYFGIRYNLTLSDSLTNCPEFLASFQGLQKLALEYGLELEYYLNFQTFWSVFYRVPQYAQLMRDMNFDAFNLSKDEWDLAGLYSVFVFRKAPTAPSRRRPKLTSKDIVIKIKGTPSASV